MANTLKAAGPAIFLAVSLLLLAGSDAEAQNRATRDSVVFVPGDPQYYIGVIGGYAHIWNMTQIPIISGEDCGTFDDGTAHGFFGGLSFDYIVIPNLLQVSARGLYSHRPAQLQTECINDLEVLDPDTDEYVPFVRDHFYEGALDYLVIDIGVRVTPVKDIPIYARLSFDAGMPLFGSDFEQIEEIASPLSVVFPDGTQRRSTGAGEIDAAGTAYGALVGVGATIPFQPGLTIEPEVAFRYGLNSILSDAEWKSNMLHLALGLHWEMRERVAKIKKVDAPPEEQVPDNEVVSAPVPLRIEDINSTPLEVRETIVTQTIPLLPYLFFDESEAQLRRRYRLDVENKDSFEPAKLPRETLTTYYHVLNIVGKRMRDIPSARLEITGTTDGEERSTPAERLALARERAEEVAAFLRDNWDIDPGRLDIGARETPELASSEEYPEGKEENRRVELYSGNPDILAPVVHSRFQEFVAVHSEQEFSVQVLQQERADSWDLSVFHRDNLLTLQKGEGVPPERISLPLTRESMVKLGRHISPSDSLRGELQVVQDDGSVITAECFFPMQKSRDKFEVSRLSLIVFDFDRSDITSTNKKMMEQFVGDAIRAESKASITGSTDRLGERDYNIELSQNRAENIRDFLLTLKPDADIVSVRGIGFSSLPYDNNLPEGRYYCRTVALEVRTPVDN